VATRIGHRQCHSLVADVVEGNFPVTSGRPRVAPRATRTPGLQPDRAHRGSPPMRNICRRCEQRPEHGNRGLSDDRVCGGADRYDELDELSETPQGTALAAATTPSWVQRPQAATRSATRATWVAFLTTRPCRGRHRTAVGPHLLTVIHLVPRHFRPAWWPRLPATRTPTLVSLNRNHAAGLGSSAPVTLRGGKTRARPRFGRTRLDMGASGVWRGWCP